ncbi:MAG: 1-acyl-sn-glycerol-3-phosphate acyltransferase [Candidatus Adiutrix sp.]|jgi:1-acyl-sn-glycerol-3-phosphate acyltransferase|nr:1-acyl-sn-glycerol-3-phosphate acyltransferase [Candidatus Adiutrix sp.]
MNNPLIRIIHIPVYLALLVSLTIALGAASVFLSLFSPRAGRYVTNSLWGHLALDPAGLRLKTVGRENLPDSSGGFIIYANHSSMADIPTVALSTGRPVTWVAKASLGRIPFFGWALARVHMLVDRGGGAEAARKMVEEAEARLKRGEILSIFPEGTRNRGRELLLPFKKGAFILAKHTGTPIVPVAIKKAGRLWPAGKFWPRPGLIRVKIGPPLSPRPGEKLAALTLRAREALHDLLADEGW